jgi:hypothetical protein
MNAVRLEPPRWKPRQWFYSIAGLFLLQVALILQMGRRPERPVERPIFRTSVRLAVPGQDVAPLEQAVRRDDPLQLALPTPDGFSGAAWLRFTPPDYQIPDVTNPAHWLALDPPILAETFRTFVATNAVIPARAADRPAPRLTRFEPAQPTEPVRTRSRLFITEDLASRTLISPIELPSFASSDILSNTVIRVGVDADGVASVAMLLSPSGSREADAYGEEFARRARFRPLRLGPGVAPATAPLTWGGYVFRWHTIPPQNPDRR